MKRICIILLAACLSSPSCKKDRPVPTQPKQAAPASSSWVTDLTRANYESFRGQTGKVTVIDFYADWCGPCRKLAPLLASISNKHAGKILVGKVNVDHERELAAKEGVRGIPDVRIYRDGLEVDRFVGLPSEADVRSRLEAHLKDPPKPKAAAEAVKPPAPQPTIQPMPKDWLPPGMQRR